MLKLNTVIGFGFGLLLGSILSLNARQELLFPPDLTQQPQIIEISLPKVTFDLKNIIDVLCDYNLQHQRGESPMNGRFYGLTDFRSRVIFINDQSDLAERRDTIIHEILHVLYRNLGVSTGDPLSEALLDSKVREIYNNLYGSQIIEKVK